MVILFFSLVTGIYFGAISDPCCNNAPIANHIEFWKLNWFSNSVGSSMHGYGLSHSAGQIRPRKNRVHETAKHAPAKYIQTSTENGDINENVDGGFFVGLRYKIEIPKWMRIELGICCIK